MIIEETSQKAINLWKPFIDGVFNGDDFVDLKIKTRQNLNQIWINEVYDLFKYDPEEDVFSYINEKRNYKIKNDDFILRATDI